MDDQRQEQIQNVISDSISDGVFTVDEDWRITTFNRAAAEITGVPSEEAVGKHCCDVFRSSVCEKECALRETLDTGRPVINKAVYIVDARNRRVPISISTGILRDADGKVIGGVETFRDLSLVEELRKELQDKHSFVDIIGRSHAMRQLFDILPQIAESDCAVLIEGESGTGKELVAQAIHELSFRRDNRFVAVNCGALPDTLLESELFGYKAGAFTDARQDKPGRFSLAHGGTLLLDEIGDTSPALQVRLLRALQEGTIEPLGSVESLKVNVRVIAATNKSLATLVHEGALREDLYYRINVVCVRLPALRERREDIPLLIDHFVGKFNRLRGKAIIGVSESAMAALMAHEFPGNVRELENVIEHAFVLCPEGLIDTCHLPSQFQGRAQAKAPNRWRGMTLAALENIHITDAMRRHHGNRKAAAGELGINPSTLYRKLKALESDSRDNSETS
ncbi:MAG: PAS domain-containing protein [bacterium]|nr:PAS domain-containing protein [bacterium]